jgi:hypothetical protein
MICPKEYNVQKNSLLNKIKRHHFNIFCFQAKNIEVSQRAVSNWMNILEAFYYCFRIYPYAAKNFRSLKKDKLKIKVQILSTVCLQPNRLLNA